MSYSQLDAFRGGESLVRIVGHRGARGIMPENTLIGFEWTLGMGIDALEFDVVLTKDGVPVIVHNHHLTASTTRDINGAWLAGKEPSVAELTYEEICTYDVGGIDIRADYGQRFPDQAFLSDIRVPKLAELLELVTKPRFSKAALMLEIKSNPNSSRPEITRSNTVEKVVSAVREAGLAHRTILHSFDWEMLAECQRQAPDMPSSFLTQLPENEDDVGEDSSHAFGAQLHGAQSVPDMVAQAGGNLWCPYVKDLNAKDVGRARELGLLVVTWTANDLDDINNAIELGVDGIVSDYPGRVQHALLNKGIRWTPANEKPVSRRYPTTAAV